MKKQITVLLIAVACTCILTGCAKNIDKMTDEEVYDYLSVMDENELTEVTSQMTEKQQKRAAMILTLMEAQKLQERDDFKSGISIITEPSAIFDTLVDPESNPYNEETETKNK